eukprot:gene28973-40603_t
MPLLKWAVLLPAAALPSPAAALQRCTVWVNSGGLLCTDTFGTAPNWVMNAEVYTDLSRSSPTPTGCLKDSEMDVDQTGQWAVHGPI